MANTPTSTPLARWNSANQNLDSLRKQLEACEPQDRMQLQYAVAEAEDYMLGFEAPHLSALLQKLYYLFDIDLDKLDRDGLHKRCIVADLRRLIGLPVDLPST